MGCSDWIALADVLITAILTVIIIYQTHKLNNKQIEFERMINQKDEDLQKRQIQIDTFPYKREIYTNTFAVIECSKAIKVLSTMTDFNCKTGKELSDMFSNVCNKYVPNVKATLWNLKEAEYILPENISKAILKIRSCFDKICSCFNALEIIESILTKEERENDFPKTKRDYISDVISNCEKVIDTSIYIESILPKELKISGLNR